MTDREKLIEILSVPIYPHLDAEPAEVVADYLIDNGVVPVVRCKDCKHWDENYEICLPDNERGCKCKTFTVDEEAPIYTAPTGYCWCGKRRADNE